MVNTHFMFVTVISVIVGEAELAVMACVWCYHHMIIILLVELSNYMKQPHSGCVEKARTLEELHHFFLLN